MDLEKTSSEKTEGRSLKIPSATWTLILPQPPVRAEYKGQTYYFCSQGCVKRFNADPEKYLAPKPAIAELPKSQMVQIGGITSTETQRTICAATTNWEGNCHLRLPYGPGSPREQAWSLPKVRHGSGIGNRGIHLSHASGNSAQRPGQLPDLRNGP